MCFSFVLANKSFKRKLLLSSLIAILVFTNPLIINSVFRIWESTPKSYSQIKHVRVAVVLGGFSNSTQQPRDRVHFVKGADRLIHALELYKLGKVDKILLSGGTAKIIGEKRSEALSVLPFLKNMGIPDEDILMESTSRNTHENAENTAALLKKNFPGENFLLITSAFHMKRSLACFKKQGLEMNSFPTDYYSKEFVFSPGNTILPRSDAFVLWNIIIKEWIGIMAYKSAGYI